MHRWRGRNTLEREGSAGASRVEVERLRYPAGHCLQHHAHARAMFCYAVRGGYREQTATRVLMAGPGSVVYQPSGELHCDAVGPDGLSGIRVEVDGAWVDAIPGLRDSGPTLVGGRAAWFARALYDEVSRKGPAIPVAQESLALLVLTEVSRDSMRQERTLPAVIARVRERLREEFADPPSLTELAADVDRHPAHLARSFRQHMSCTIGEYLRECRLTAAKELVERTDRPLADVALACGYADQSHMGRSFRRHIGLSPAAYRRRGR